MESILERLRKKELEIKGKRDKLIFVKIESNNNKTLYHTKIMKDLYAFGINKNQRNKFFISFRKLFNRERIESFHLFSLKDDDKFLGIFYGYRKPIKNVVTRYEDNGIMKTSTFSKAYYIEFRFKKGSVFCYLKEISYLLKKDKSNTKYSKFLIEKLANLEKQIYEFYGKNLPDGGFINKWIEKKLQ
ncbi:DUF226 domain-containing protein (plasmid) [Borrelia coriaceae]|uniref:Putative cytosolic protein n=1 Tax=Borrelia coriaceae ATCC 43381 TaxID=1408429 RepID=W5SVX1_9SPIR|nr:DUF226 domain-containing protein [Borrelia coriaceae]AHH11339.1 Putative cytosolic protein [Borrelia coriaceae ATCC 43381]UPA17352.1 DUF226 domain-containing protein [Borrelia coriaceae]